MEEIKTMREVDIERLEEVNKTLATLDIKGKDYVPVNERIKAFRHIYPRGRIVTEIIGLDNGVCTMKCEVWDDDGRLLATGHSQEKEGSTFINKTSFIENCETSVVGRALGNCGIGLDCGFASYEEVANAKAQQEKLTDKNWQGLKRVFNNDEIKAMYQECGVTNGKDLKNEYVEAKIKERLINENKASQKDFY